MSLARASLHACLWPLFLPVLLPGPSATAHAAGRARELTDTIDELCRTLEAVRAA
ncbi:MAG: hypothetical protein JXB05_29040 [Myxococcaceae bacterium]|nr:hypothetical protein [Myxococcaceae bacterium]